MLLEPSQVEAMPPPQPTERTLTLPLPPSVNAYWRSLSMLRGRALKFPMVIVSDEGKAYKKRVASMFGGLWIPASKRFVNHEGEPIQPWFPSGALGYEVTVYRQKKVGDLSNRLKVLEDALNGLAWADDGQIVEIIAHRNDDKVNPRVELRIWKL